MKKSDGHIWDLRTVPKFFCIAFFGIIELRSSLMVELYWAVLATVYMCVHKIAEIYINMPIMFHIIIYTYKHILKTE